MEKKIASALLGLGLPTSNKGYHYCKTFMEVRLRDKDRKLQDTYGKVAKIHHTQPANIERNIRRAIDCAYNLNGLELFNRMFGQKVVYDKPTVSMFVGLLDEYFAVFAG